MFAVNGATGQVIWEYKFGLRRAPSAAWRSAAGRVFAALGQASTWSRSNQQTGALIWQAQVGTTGQDTSANGAATPWTLYYKGLVLVGTENGGGAGHARPPVRAAGHQRQPGLELRRHGRARPARPQHLEGHFLDARRRRRVDGPGRRPPARADLPRGGQPRAAIVGAGRAGNDLYTNSLVALHASTGKLDWYFQSVHHDLWDYDNTMSPVIADVRYPHGARKVVIYGSKTGWLYYLNAKTGKPAIPVREKKVPQLAPGHVPDPADPGGRTRWCRPAPRAGHPPGPSPTITAAASSPPT